MRLSSLRRKFGGNPSAASAYALLPIGYPMGRFGPVRCIPLADGATLTTLYLQFVAGDGNLVRLAGSSNIHAPLRGSGLNPSRSARP